MRRLLTFSVVLILVCFSVVAQQRFGSIVYRTITTAVDVPGERWYLLHGNVVRFTIADGTTQVTHRWVAPTHTPGVAGMKLNTTYFPRSFQFTSGNSPLVSGSIVRILMDAQYRIWACNCQGDVSMFDGIRWETLPHLSNSTLSCYDDVGMLDIAVKNGTMRIAASTFIDEIDMRTFKRSRLIDFNHALSEPVFLGFDLVVDERFANGIFIDRPNDRAYNIRIRDSLSLDGILEHLPLKSAINNRAVPAKEPADPSEIELGLRSAVAAEIQRYTTAIDLRDAREQARALGFRSRLNSRSIMGGSCLGNSDYDGQFVDMIADANGTIYIAGRDGITVIPSTAGGVAVKVVDTTLAALQLHPNPATNQVFIDVGRVPSEETTAQFIDASGNTSMSLPLRAASTTLDVSKLLSGVYTVVVSTSTNRAARSLVIQR